MTRFLRSLALLLALAVAPAVRAQDAAPTTSTPDGKFTIVRELERTPTLSQDMTGTCWSFATVSFFESEARRLGKGEIDLSEIYPVYFAYLEKARAAIEKGGELKWGQGGLSHDLQIVIDKYGMVPQSAYTGLCEGDKRHDHGELERALKGLIGAMTEKSARGRVRKPGPKWEAAVRGVLDAYLGAPPETFEFEGKTWTPKSFAAERLGMKPAAYLEIMSFESQPMWSEAVLDVPDNWWRFDGYRNVPVEALMRSLDHALAEGYTVALDIDVSEPGFNPRAGTAVLPEDLEKEGAVTDALREQQFKSGETTDDHLMHVVGIAEDGEGRRFYRVKNSWGRMGPYGGDVFMSRNYVALKTLAFMVHKDGLPADVRKKVSP